MIEIIATVAAIGIKIQATFSHPPDMQHYRWTNQVLVDEKPPRDCNGDRPTVPYFDPPPCGWDYLGGGADSDKYYWDSEYVELYRYTEAHNRRNNVYVFEDYPSGVIGEMVLFETCLVDTRINENHWCTKWKLTKTGVKEYEKI